MARNGSGTYNRAVAPYVAGTTITAATVNQEMDDLAAALTQSMSRDGQAPATANIPMGGFRLTGLGNAISNTDAAPLGQVLAKAGDTMTGAVGVIAGTAAAPGVFVAGDTNTGLFQAAAAPDTLSVSVGGVEVGRYGAGGFMRLAAGTAAAPAFSFSGDTDTGIFQSATNVLDLSAGGSRLFQVNNSGGNSFAALDNVPGQAFTIFYLRAIDASASNLRTGAIQALNESSVPVVALDMVINTNGSSSLSINATPAGARNTDRRVNRVFIPGSGAIDLVGPVNVDGKPLQIQRGTEQATNTGQVQYDFLSIPAGVRRITVALDGVSTNGTNQILLRIGTSSGFVATGYVGGASQIAGSSSSISATGFMLFQAVVAANSHTGLFSLQNLAGNTWVFAGSAVRQDGIMGLGAGSLTLGDVLDRVRITTVGSTNTFDAGSVNIMWEF